MTCRTCGAELPVDAKFCHQCGTPTGDDAPTEIVTPEHAEADVAAEEAGQAADEHDPALEHAPIDGGPAEAPEGVDTHIVDAVDPVQVPPTELVEPTAAAERGVRELPSSPALPPDDTQTGITSPALQAAIPTPPRSERSRRPLEERGAWEEFTGAIAPLLRAPRFTGNLLAALVAFLVSFVAALVAWAIFRGPAQGREHVLLPGFVDTDRDGAGVLALLTLAFHQVPFISGSDMDHGTPLLLALIPLFGCAVGLVVARRMMPCSGRRDGFFMRVLPFALSYAVLLFLWSLLDAQDWHAAHGRSFLAGLVFAFLGAWLAERWLRSHGEANLAGGDTTSAARAGGGAPPPTEPQATRLWQPLATGARVFAAVVGIASIGWLAGTIVAQVQARDSEASAASIVESVLHVIEGGFEAIGFGVLAEGTPFGFVDDDEGWRVYELGEVLPDAAVAIYMVVAFAAVLVGGLFSGFAIARRVAPRSRNDHALFGAVTGLVWGAAMLLAHVVVLSRSAVDEDLLTAFDGSELVLLSLLVGGLLGALGGMLFATSRGRTGAGSEPSGGETAA